MGSTSVAGLSRLVPAARPSMRVPRAQLTRQSSYPSFARGRTANGVDWCTDPNSVCCQGGGERTCTPKISWPSSTTLLAPHCCTLTPSRSFPRASCFRERSRGFSRCMHRPFISRGGLPKPASVATSFNLELIHTAPACPAEPTSPTSNAQHPFLTTTLQWTSYCRPSSSASRPH